MISRLHDEQDRLLRSGNLEALECQEARTWRPDNEPQSLLSEVLVDILPEKYVKLAVLSPADKELDAFNREVDQRFSCELSELRALHPKTWQEVLNPPLDRYLAGLPREEREHKEELLASCDRLTWSLQAQHEVRHRVPDIIAIAQDAGIDDGQIQIIRDLLAGRSIRDGANRLQGKEAQRAYRAAYERWRTSGKVAFIAFCRKFDGGNELVSGVIEIVETRDSHQNRRALRAIAELTLPNARLKIPGAQLGRAPVGAKCDSSAANAEVSASLERAREFVETFRKEHGWAPDTSRSPFEFLVPLGRRSINSSPQRKPRRKRDKDGFYAAQRSDYRESSLATLLESDDAESHS